MINYELRDSTFEVHYGNLLENNTNFWPWVEIITEVYNRGKRLYRLDIHLFPNAQDYRKVGIRIGDNKIKWYASLNDFETSLWKQRHKKYVIALLGKYRNNLAEILL